MFLFSSIYSTAGGSMLGDVNISAILDSFSVSYDKRVRPNYGGKNRSSILFICRSIKKQLFSKFQILNNRLSTSNSKSGYKLISF